MAVGVGNQVYCLQSAHRGEVAVAPINMAGDSKFTFIVIDSSLSISSNNAQVIPSPSS